MDLSHGIHIYFLVVFTYISCAVGSQLYLQPVKKDHAYFTEDNFFVTCFTTDDSIDKLTWTDTDSNSISTREGRIHAQAADGDQMGLRLVFKNVQTEDAGTYTCSDDQESTSFDLTVYRALSFGDTQSVQHAPEGDSGVVLCNVKADPKPVVNWYLKGKKISNSKKYNISKENHSLKIHNLSRVDAGEYKCKAFVITPLSSQVKDLDITLHVQYIPEIVGPAKLVRYASVGHRTSLDCGVEGEPAPLFQWLHDDMIIHNNTRDFVIHNTHNTSTLQMSVDEERFGEYICRASNPLGEKEVTIELREGHVPPAPKLTVVGEDQGTVKLSLRAVQHDVKPKGDALPVEGFKVEYITATETWKEALEAEFNLGESYVLRNMSFNSDYVLRAAARNAAGYGNYTDDLPYKTHTLQTASVTSGAASFASAIAALLICFALLL